LEDPAGIAEVLHHLGETALLQGDDARAMALEQESLAIARDPWTLINLGYLAQHEGDYRRASVLLTESLVIARERSTRWYMWAIPECLAGFASIASRQGQPERAARLFGAAETLHEAIHNLPVHAHQVEIECTVAIVQASLDETAFAAAWAEGCAMTLEQAIACALECSAVDVEQPARAIATSK
jgi:tetratricopeptide (TPR) repeat protein